MRGCMSRWHCLLILHTWPTAVSTDAWDTLQMQRNSPLTCFLALLWIKSFKLGSKLFRSQHFRIIVKDFSEFSRVLLFMKLSLSLIKHRAMKTCWGVNMQLYAFLRSTLHGSECSASRPDRFSQGQTVSNTYWMGGGVDPIASLDAVKRKIFSPAGNRTPIPPW
jgi:hypothetical protein